MSQSISFSCFSWQHYFPPWLAHAVVVVAEAAVCALVVAEVAGVVYRSISLLQQTNRVASLSFGASGSGFGSVSEPFGVFAWWVFFGF